VWIVKEARQHLSQDSPYAATILNAKHPKCRGAYVELMKSHWTD
jgi:protein-L-isoaspartate O-methyltransferase